MGHCTDIIEAMSMIIFIRQPRQKLGEWNLEKKGNMATLMRVSLVIVIPKSTNGMTWFHCTDIGKLPLLITFIQLLCLRLALVWKSENSVDTITNMKACNVMCLRMQRVHWKRK